MTAKERLREAIEGLDDDQAERALNALAAVGALPKQRSSTTSVSPPTIPTNFDNLRPKHAAAFDIVPEG